MFFVKTYAFLTSRHKSLISYPHPPPTQIEVQSQSYQANQGLPGYDPVSFTNITVGIFRRTRSTLSHLVGLRLLDKFNASQNYALDRLINPNLRNYQSAQPLFYNTSVLQLRITTPDTTYVCVSSLTSSSSFLFVALIPLHLDT